jgi:hypothetical protein
MADAAVFGQFLLELVGLNFKFGGVVAAVLDHAAVCKVVQAVTDHTLREPLMPQLVLL